MVKHQLNVSTGVSRCSKRQKISNSVRHSLSKRTNSNSDSRPGFFWMMRQRIAQEMERERRRKSQWRFANYWLCETSNWSPLPGWIICGSRQWFRQTQCAISISFDGDMCLGYPGGASAHQSVVQGNAQEVTNLSWPLILQRGLEGSSGLNVPHGWRHWRSTDYSSHHQGPLYPSSIGCHYHFQFLTNTPFQPLIS